jgi:ribosome recycling factor
MLKDKAISEDDEKRGLEQVQKLTDQHIKQIDEMARHKEDEILKI